MGGAVVKEKVGQGDLERLLNIGSAFGWVSSSRRDEILASSSELETTVEELFKSFHAIEAIEDPWRHVPEEEIIKRVTNDIEELAELQVEESADLVTYNEDLEHHVTESQLDSNMERQQVAVKVACSDADWRVTGAARNNVIALSLVENATPIAASPMLCGTPWLRFLSLSSVSLPCGTLDFGGLSKLMVLDLSFTDLSSVSVDFTPLAQMLRRLWLDGCSLDSLPSSIQHLSNLRVLSAQDNNIEDALSLVDTVLCHLGKLEELDLRENPFAESSEKTVQAFHEMATARVQSLKILDNKILNQDTGNLKLAGIETLREDMNRTDTVADHNEDRGSCSCLEGTPCEVEYTCKDWKHRFQIAKLVREQP